MKIKCLLECVANLPLSLGFDLWISFKFYSCKSKRFIWSQLNINWTFTYRVDCLRIHVDITSRL